MAKRAGFDVATAAASLDRFEFIARFVALMTRRSADRAVTSGLEVRAVDGGYVYGFHGMPASCRAVDAAGLYDMIRRTALNYWVQQAEELRVVALAA